MNMVRRIGKGKVSCLRIAGWILLPLTGMATYGLTIYFSTHNHITEKFYSSGWYAISGRLLSNFSSLVPFSLSDIFYAVLILLAFLFILLSLFKKIGFGRMLLLQLNLAAAVYILFYWLWGFNYFRQPATERLGFKESTADAGEFMQVFAEVVEHANSSRIEVPAEYGTGFVDSLVEVSYSRFADFLQLDIFPGSRRPKFMTLGNLFAKAGISGYYGPFFNEIHLNPHMHPLELPVVLAHEKAHQFGVTSEAETSFFGWLVCYYSDHDYLKYAASIYAIRYFLNHGYGLEGFADVVQRIQGPVKADLRSIRDHWMSMRVEKIDKVASRANDVYLKSNKVEKGIADYQGVVSLIMSFKTDSLMMERLLPGQVR
jgi:hypothetical protein